MGRAATSFLIGDTKVANNIYLMIKRNSVSFIEEDREIYVDLYRSWYFSFLQDKCTTAREAFEYFYKFYLKISPDKRGVTLNGLRTLNQVCSDFARKNVKNKLDSYQGFCYNIGQVSREEVESHLLSFYDTDFLLQFLSDSFDNIVRCLETTEWEDSRVPENDKDVEITKDIKDVFPFYRAILPADTLLRKAKRDGLLGLRDKKRKRKRVCPYFLIDVSGSMQTYLGSIWGKPITAAVIAKSLALAFVEKGKIRFFSEDVSPIVTEEEIKEQNFIGVHTDLNKAVEKVLSDISNEELVLISDLECSLDKQYEKDMKDAHIIYVPVGEESSLAVKLRDQVKSFTEMSMKNNWMKKLIKGVL